MNWGQEAYQNMENHNWTTDELTIDKIEQASALLQTLKKKP